MLRSAVAVELHELTAKGCSLFLSCCRPKIQRDFRTMKRFSSLFYTCLAMALLALPCVAMAASSQAKVDGFKSLVAVVISLGIGYWFFNMCIEERQRRHNDGIPPEKYETAGDFLVVNLTMLVLSAVTAGPIAGAIHFMSGSSIGIVAWLVCTAVVFGVALYLKNT